MNFLRSVLSRLSGKHGYGTMTWLWVWCLDHIRRTAEINSYIHIDSYYHVDHLNKHNVYLTTAERDTISSYLYQFGITWIVICKLKLYQVILIYKCIMLCLIIVFVCVLSLLIGPNWWGRYSIYAKFRGIKTCQPNWKATVLETWFIRMCLNCI